MASSPAETDNACPACGFAMPLEDLLARFESERAVRFLADGGAEVGHHTLTQQCRRCLHSVQVTVKRVASQIIERQTQDLFASITAVLRGNANLH